MTPETICFFLTHSRSGEARDKKRGGTPLLNTAALVFPFRKFTELGRRGFGGLKRGRGKKIVVCSLSPSLATVTGKSRGEVSCSSASDGRRRRGKRLDFAAID